MPVLSNPKHERFAQERAKGATADAAYQKAGYKPDRGAASRMSAKVSIQARIEELAKRVEEKFTMTRVEWLESFRRGARAAEKAEDYAAMRGHLREIGLAMPGWYAPEEQKHDGKVEIVILKQ